MALSSGGQRWLKQTRQMRHKTTSKHELIVTDAPRKNFELRKLNVPGMLFTVIMQHFGWQLEDFTDISYLKANSIPGAPSRHQGVFLDNIAAITMTPQSIKRLYVNRSPVIMFSISSPLFSCCFALFSVQIIRTRFNTQIHDSNDSNSNSIPSNLVQSPC